MGDQELEIGDVESYEGSKDKSFSHQSLVMIAMKKCVEYGTMEQLQGVYISEKDGRGNTKITYKQDTRRAFIESVRTCKMIMICDFDKDSKKNISALLEKAKKRKKELIEEQKKWWNALKNVEKMAMHKRGIVIFEDHFSTELPFIQTYLFEELEIYRSIFEELTKLTERKDFYKGEIFKA